MAASRPRDEGLVRRRARLPRSMPARRRLRPCWPGSIVRRVNALMDIRVAPYGVRWRRSPPCGTYRTPPPAPGEYVESLAFGLSYDSDSVAVVPMGRAGTRPSRCYERLAVNLTTSLTLGLVAVASVTRRVTLEPAAAEDLIFTVTVMRCVVAGVQQRGLVGARDNGRRDVRGSVEVLHGVARRVPAGSGPRCSGLPGPSFWAIDPNVTVEPRADFLFLD